MNKKLMLGCVVVLLAISASAQSQKDIQNIQKLAGCFNVSFNYAETFTNDTTKKRYAHPLDKRTVVEMVLPLQQSPKKIVLQHILVAVNGTIIKHWREDWEYEKSTIWLYDKDKTWRKQQLSAAAVKGKWMQTVWEVDDAPRYQGLSNWVETNGQTFWLSTTDAPLPRREYIKRSDYNVMQRTNKIIVSDKGWMHEQDNKKIIRKDNMQDSLLAEEKGYNYYERTTDAACTQASTYWSKERAQFWKDVVTVWEGVMQNATVLTLQTTVDGKMLYEAIGELEAKAMAGENVKDKIAGWIQRYIVTQ